MKSKIFTDIENQFAQAGELTILETAHQALDDLVKVLTDYDDRTLFTILIHAAKLGVSGDGVVNKKERKMLVSLFSDIMPGFEDMIDDLFAGEITEDDCNLVAALSQIGNEVAMPLLYYILSLSYADEVLEENIALELDSIFEPILTALVAGAANQQDASADKT